MIFHCYAEFLRENKLEEKISLAWSVFQRQKIIPDSKNKNYFEDIDSRHMMYGSFKLD
jgi:hypothetical protein